MDRKKMHVYKLKRTKKIDKLGRPAIFLKSFAKKSLVWAGSTVLRPEEKREAIEINKIKTYFYTHNLETVETKYLVEEWKKDKISNEIFALNSDQEKQLISKFTEFTNQEDPYKEIQILEEIIKNLKNKIINLELENQNLKNKQKILKNEKEILNSKIKNKAYENE